MAALALEIVGELPDSLALEPLQTAFISLTEAVPTLPDGVINLAFLSDEEMRNLNLTYSGNDYVTDVLSFDYREDGGPIGDVIGEIAISHETAIQQAAKAGTDLSSEVALLGVHGVLHILGYDHATEVEQIVVEGLQKEILHEAKVPYREFKWES